MVGPEIAAGRHRAQRCREPFGLGDAGIEHEGLASADLLHRAQQLLGMHDVAAPFIVKRLGQEVVVDLLDRDDHPEVADDAPGDRLRIRELVGDRTEDRLVRHRVDQAGAGALFILGDRQRRSGHEQTFVDAQRWMVEHCEAVAPACFARGLVRLIEDAEVERVPLGQAGSEGGGACIGAEDQQLISSGAERGGDLRRLCGDLHRQLVQEVVRFLYRGHALVAADAQDVCQIQWGVAYPGLQRLADKGQRR